MVNDLLNQGRNVEIIPKSNVANVKSPDFILDGVITELKTLNGTSLNTPVTRIKKGFTQGAERVILDGRKNGFTIQQARNTLGRISGIYDDGVPGTIEIWTSDGYIIFGGR